MVEKRILIVDDVPEVTRLLTYNLSKEGYSVDSASTGAEALEILRASFHGLVLVDLRLPDCNGLDLFNEIKQIAPDSLVIIITAHGSIDIAIRAIQAGAFDFITKTENIVERLFVATHNAFRQMELNSKVRKLTSEMGSRFSFDQIVTDAREMKHLFKTLEHVIESKVTVLIEGESGTGKEVIARAIHHNGPRKEEAFVPINCAGIPDTLLESELFGFEKGAFTGAVARKPGKFELADKGTIFLDEIGEMNPNLQSKILRVIQEREFERLGGTETVSVDVRILSATNRNLLEEVKKGNFREDLYYRLSVFQVTLPPLREREGDVPILTRYFIKKFATEEKKPVRNISQEAQNLLSLHLFPGNVRQLENVISHAIVVCETDTIEIDDIPQSFVNEAWERQDAGSSPGTLETRLETLIRSPERVPKLKDLEAAVIRRAIELHDNNVAAAAKRMGISRATLYRRMEQLGLNRE